MMKSLLLSLLLLPLVARAEIRLPAVFADHLVLQRDLPVPVWGSAEAGEMVEVKFAGQKKTAKADASGKWRVSLDPLEASARPRELKIGSRVIRDVLVGEVWLASGQSNMGFPLASAHQSGKALEAAGDPLLRFFTVQNATAAEPQDDLRGRWDLSTPIAARSFSAVAYYFAKGLREKLDVPVAILHSSWGGTPAQAWLSVDALRQDPPFTNYVKRYEDALVKHRDVLAQPSLMEAYRRDLAQWQKETAPAYNEAMKAWNAGPKTEPKPRPARPEPVNPDPMDIPSPSSRPGTPGVIFNARIAPLAGYALRGALWYQGEANASQGIEYRTLLPRLIGDWRKRWGQGDFPFLVVQLAGWDMDKNPAPFHQWPWLREAQTLTVSQVPQTALAVAIDVGDPADVHPKGKEPVGQRLVLAARKLAYGETKLVASGPVFKEAKPEGAALRVSFTSTGRGLVIGQAPWRPEGATAWPVDRLTGFSVAGADRQWHEADARISGDSILVSSPAVAQPVAVRYAWANAPRCNLYNKEGLPAVPFRSDDWPLPSKK
jgi:sialate O-acetylesterase